MNTTPLSQLEICDLAKVYWREVEQMTTAEQIDRTYQLAESNIIIS